MKAAHWILTVLAVSILAGCLGPGGSGRPTTTENPFQPRNSISFANVSGVQVREPTADEYYYIHVTGSENWTLVSGRGAAAMACTRAWTFTAFRHNQTLVYNASRYVVDPTHVGVAIGENLWGVTFFPTRLEEGCPTTYGVRFHERKGFQNYSSAFGAYGPIKFRVFRDGSLILEYQKGLPLVELGKKVIVSYGRLRAHTGGTYFIEGGFEVANLGPWAKDGLVGSGKGTVSRG